MGRESRGGLGLRRPSTAIKAEWSAETICFHAQQCVEKYIKALLVLCRVDFPKTHDIRRLVTILPPGVRPDLSVAESRTR